MKRKSSFRNAVMISFLVIGFCIGATQSALAFTTVYLDLVDPYVFVDETTNGIASIQFGILDPVDVATFSLNLPAGWYDFSVGDLASAFDGTPDGTASLPNGELATFNMDVLLDGWEFALQDGTVLTMGDNFPIEYTVLFDGTDYTITNVPIPPALLLFGSGIIGMLGLRRKFNK